MVELFIFEVLVGISVFLLFLATLCYKHEVAFAAVVGLYSFLSGLLIFGLAPWLLTTYLGVFITWGICRQKRWSRWRFSGIAASAVVCVWGIAFWQFLPEWREIQGLARDFPVQHIDERLAYEQSRARFSSDDNIEASPSEIAMDETQRLADEIHKKSGRWQWYRNPRMQSLISLHHTHNNFVRAFARQEGFGVGRLTPLQPRDKYIRTDEPRRLALSSPPRNSDSAEADASLNWQYREGVTENTRDWHAASVANFSNADGFGFLLGWRNPTDAISKTSHGTASILTRGFQSHGFQSIPEDSPVGNDWQLARVDLVSLLKHDPPAVYLSDALPRMEELADDDIPTRKLDPFEAQALEQLDDGEVIVVRRSRNRIRMLGAILATQECIKCHFVSQGEMLGAFSYEFWRKEPLPAKNVPDKATPPLL